ncbi:MAG TPA: molybdenum cofactor biosynthesis protein MoaE [Stellaceae bacterium]|nr:molybdenum cofactor biosynthesis protein MoaE [Stellaceae bacterium]
MIRVQREDFDVGREIETLTRGKTAIGGIVTFVGTVRDAGGADAVKSMTLEHYPGMTEDELTAIDAEANKRWKLEASLIVHRYGTLLPGEHIVLVVTAAAHRTAAFAASEFLVDWLKTKAPFWKQEETPQGARWVEAQDSDEQAAKRWAKG